MDFNGNKIKTPKDHPWDFDPDWRNEIAKGVVDTGAISHPYGSDEYIRWQVQFLKAVNSDDERPLSRYDRTLYRGTEQPEHRAVVRAHQLYNSSGASCMRDKVDAMLLCPELSLEDIVNVLSSQNMSSDPLDLQVYEKLYFNIRDDAGKVDAGCWLREWFASRGQMQILRQDLPAYWRVLAFQGGHKLLFSIWRWPAINIEEADKEQHMSLMRNTFCELEARTRFGDINNRDLVALYGHLQNQVLEMRKVGLLGGDTATGEGDLGAFVELLQAAGPEPIVPDQSKLAEKEPEVAQKLDMVKRTTRTHGGGSSDSLDGMSAKMEAATSRQT